MFEDFLGLLLQCSAPFYQLFFLAEKKRERTHKLCFAGWWSFCNRLEILHRDPFHVLQGRTGVEHHVFYKNTDGSQHVGHKQMHVDVVPGAVQSPERRGEETNHFHADHNTFKTGETHDVDTSLHTCVKESMQSSKHPLWKWVSERRACRASHQAARSMAIKVISQQGKRLNFSLSSFFPSNFKWTI